MKRKPEPPVIIVESGWVRDSVKAELKRIVEKRKPRKPETVATPRKKRGRRLPTTPRSKVRAAIRQLWLRSRERAAALKRDGYTCQKCHRKQSKAKGKEFMVEVHHLNGIEWENIIDYIFRHVLVDPKELETICQECHAKEHAIDWIQDDDDVLKDCGI